jgi:hypothetical protein
MKRRAMDYGLGWRAVKNEAVLAKYNSEIDAIVSDFLFLTTAVLGFLVGYFIHGVF